jgi:membrane protease YdiL (CAAX protease family)
MRRNIGASESSAIFIFGLVGASLLSYFLQFFVKLGSFGGIAVANWLAYVFPPIAYFAVVAIYSAVRRVDALYIAKVKRPLNFLQFALLPFIAVATIMTFLPVANLFLNTLYAMGYPQGSVILPLDYSAGIYFLSLLVMAVLPAFGEELLVRGMLFNGLSTRGIWFGICISALLFSLMHNNAEQTVYQFGLGVVLCLVVVLSGSIWPAVVLHFLNNFITITIDAYIPEIDTLIASLGAYNYLTGAISVIVGLFLLVFLLFAFHRIGKGRSSDYYRNVTDGLVYDEFTIYATDDQRAADKAYKKRNGFFASFGRFFASLFKKGGWRQFSRELEYQNGVTYIGRAQPMFNVWIAVGFGVLNWIMALLSAIAF